MEVVGTEGSDDHYSFGKQVYKFYQICMSLNSIPYTLQCLRYFVVYREIGVLILVASEMMSDLTTFITLLAAVTFGFCLSLSGLQLAGESIAENLEADNFLDANSAFFVPMWSIYGQFDPVSAGWIRNTVWRSLTRSTACDSRTSVVWSGA